MQEEQEAAKSDCNIDVSQTDAATTNSNLVTEENINENSMTFRRFLSFGYNILVSSSADNVTLSSPDEIQMEISVERTTGGLGLSIAGGKGSTPFKGDDEGIFISKVTETGPAYKAGLRVSFGRFQL